MTIRKEIDYYCGKTFDRTIYEIESRNIVIDENFLRMARFKDEFEDEIVDPEAIVSGLLKCRCPADVFTFWDRIPREDRQFPYRHDKLAQALLPVSTYEEWWSRTLSKQARKNINHSIKSGVEIRIEPYSQEILRGIKEIFDETPIRRGKKCWHYQKSLEELNLQLSRDLASSEFILAYYKQELIGFIKLIYRDTFADPVVFISKTCHFEKYPNNLLLAKCVERCATKGLPYVHYSDWRLKSHSEFLRRHGFEKLYVNRYYIPLNWKGRVLLRLGAQQTLWSRVPDETKYWILKLREWWITKVVYSS